MSRSSAGRYGGAVAMARAPRTRGVPGVSRTRSALAVLPVATCRWMARADASARRVQKCCQALVIHQTPVAGPADGAGSGWSALVSRRATGPVRGAAVRLSGTSRRALAQALR